MSTLMSDDFILDADQYDEFKMWQGLIGPYYYPSVDDLGNLTWTNNGDLTNPAAVNIQGKGLTIVGIVEDATDLPETADDYVTYLVGSAAPYTGYIYDNGTWVSLGLVGASAGFGTPTATIDSGTGTPGVTITASGPDTVKIFAFAFSNLKGVPASISSTAIEYQQGDSGTTAPSGAWSTTIPSVAQGKYLWTRVTVTFNTGSPVVFYSVAYAATDGEGGSPSSSTPLADTTGGAVGSATAYARGDHQHPLNVATSGTPVMDGTAALGSATTYAKTDHVHPTDTSRASATDLTNLSGAFKAFTVTLSSSGWSSNAQTVSDAKFIASGYSYIVSPVSSSFTAYGEAQIYADNVSTDGSMTFHCVNVPSSNLMVNVVRVVAS